MVNGPVICTVCGAEISVVENQRFCQYCGEELRRRARAKIAQSHTARRLGLVGLALLCALAAQFLIGDELRWLAVAAGLAGVVVVALSGWSLRIGRPSSGRRAAPPTLPAASQAPASSARVEEPESEGDGNAGVAQSGEDGLRPESALNWLAADTRRSEKIGGYCGLAVSLLLTAFSLAGFAGEPPWLSAWAGYGLAVLTAMLSLVAIDGRLVNIAQRLLNSRGIAIKPVGWRTIATAAALVAILLLAAVIRTYHLNELPPGLYIDELTILESGKHFFNELDRVPVWDSRNNTGSLYGFLVGLISEVAGLSMTSGRLVSVFFGLAGVVAVFLLARMILGTVPALMAAFLMAVTQWGVNWSRIGMFNIASPFFIALTAWLTLRSLRSGRFFDFGLAGAALGLGIWTYSASYFFPLVIGLIMLHAVIFAAIRRQDWKRLLAGGVVMGIITAIVIAPLAEFAISDSEAFFARARQTAILGNTPWPEAWPQIKHTVTKHLGMFHIAGDQNGRHNVPGAPMLDFVSGALLLLGVALAVVRWRSAALLALPCWALVMMLPGILSLSYEAPQSLRSINVIPAIILLITLPLALTWRLSGALRQDSLRRGARLTLTVILAVIALLNIRGYFVTWAEDPGAFSSFSTDTTFIAQDVPHQLGSGRTILVTRDYAHNSTAGMLTSWPAPDVITLPADVPLAPERSRRGVVIYLSPRERSLFHTLRRYYPDADIAPVSTPNGERPLYYRAIIDREILADRQGLTGRYTLPDGSVQEKILTGVGNLQASGPEVADAVELLAEGALQIRQPGTYTFVLEGDATAAVWLDGRLLLSGEKTRAVIEPAVGLHNLQAQVAAGATWGARLLWQPPDADELRPIPSEHLFHDPVRPTGLVGRYFRNEAELPERSPDSRWMLPSLAHPDWYTPPEPEPYLAVWDGALEAPAYGDYGFRVRENFGDVTVIINDTEVLAPGQSDGSINLNAGPHPIRVIYHSATTPSRFQIWWQPPGTVDMDIIPVDRLTPAEEHMFRQLE